MTEWQIEKMGYLFWWLLIIAGIPSLFVWITGLYKLKWNGKEYVEVEEDESV